jgi:hypothetical protein
VEDGVSLFNGNVEIIGDLKEFFYTQSVRGDDVVLVGDEVCESGECGNEKGERVNESGIGHVEIKDGASFYIFSEFHGHVQRPIPVPKYYQLLPILSMQSGTVVGLLFPCEK